jgi:hypothetical protein
LVGGVWVGVGRSVVRTVCLERVIDMMRRDTTRHDKVCLAGVGPGAGRLERRERNSERQKVNAGADVGLG